CSPAAATRRCASGAWPTASSSRNWASRAAASSRTGFTQSPSRRTPAGAPPPTWPARCTSTRWPGSDLLPTAPRPIHRLARPARTDESGGGNRSSFLHDDLNGPRVHGHDAHGAVLDGVAVGLEDVDLTRLVIFLHLRGLVEREGVDEAELVRVVLGG